MIPGCKILGRLNGMRSQEEEAEKGRPQRRKGQMKK